MRIVQSSAKKENPTFPESKRKSGEDNIAWLKRHCQDVNDDTALVLLGGVDPCSFRVRVAQSNARQDLTPSHWSDILVLKSVDPITGRTPTYEASLQPADGFGFPPKTNGIQTGTMGAYKDPEAYPNIAFLALPIPRREVLAALERFQSLRHLVNGAELLVAWLAYVWGINSAPNPLLQEIGVPGAVLVEYAVGAVKFDLTPGLASRSSCPEAIWQSAKWWHLFYESKGTQGQRQGLPPSKAAQPETLGLPIRGSWCVDHTL